MTPAKASFTPSLTRAPRLENGLGRERAPRRGPPVGRCPAIGAVQDQRNELPMWVEAVEKRAIGGGRRAAMTVEAPVDRLAGAA
jgi:hypothetical protein